MTQLKRLTREAHPLVSDAFLKGDVGSLDEQVRPYVESVDAHADLENLDSRLGSIMEQYGRYDAAIDAAAAPAVHREMNISRRVASDAGIWHYLAVVRYPDFVRYRWEYTTETAMREKFLAAGTDIYSNALHRLWWIAELTCDRSGPDEYQLTERVLEDQTLANKIFDRWFARYRPAAIACAEVLLAAESDSKTVEEVTLRLRQELTSIQLEGLSRDDVCELVEQILEDVRREGANVPSN